MNVLLIDDEAGIREGLALFLRMKGHRVRTAGSAADAEREFAADRFDVVVTDWRLTDGSPDLVLRACDCPVIAVSGCPEEVAPARRLAAVLAKPVMPQRLLRAIEALPAESPGPAPSLPADTADRLGLALAILGDPAGVEVLDDGAFAVLRAVLPAVPDRAIAQLELIGGDLRVFGPDGELCVELRLCRDGRPEGARPARAWSDWTEDGRDVALDVSGVRPPTPCEFIGLLDRVGRARDEGCAVHLINIPPHLRLHAEISGRADDVPKRGKAEPRLPEILARLWS